MSVPASENNDLSPVHEGPEKNLLGIKIGGYTIERLIGVGGMGKVYAAVHATPGKRAVVKVLSELRGSGKKADEAKRRFLDEARALCTLKHPNLVQLYDWGELPDGTIYILMEYIDGPSLKDYMQDLGGKLPLAEALEIARQIAEALDTVHVAGIVHRDLTPHNIIVSPDPTTRLGVRIKILDFGIAKFRSEREGHTQTGDSFGTPRYMAPEQCEAASSVDDRADMYAMGLLLFEMLTGQSPYDVPIPTPVKWMNAHLSQRPRTLDQKFPKAPKELVRLVAALLDKTAEQRPSAREVVAFLTTGTRIRRSLRAPKFLVHVGLGMAATAVAIGSGYWMWSRSTNQPRPAVLSPTDLAALAARAPQGMVLIPGGTFVMGSSQTEVSAVMAECERLKPEGGCHADTFDRELGEHTVTLSPYYLGVHEVTNAEYADFLNRKAPRPTVEISKVGVPRKVFTADGKGGRILLADLYSQDGQGSQLHYDNDHFTVSPSAERLPVVQVSYLGAYEYCKNFHGWDLPTEAQWEFAAQASGKGQRKGAFPWSPDTSACDLAALSQLRANCPLQSLSGPTPVESHPADRTIHGVFDLAGNVSEWTRDIFVAPYRDCGRCVNPVETEDPGKTPETMLPRVFRGGSFHLSTVAARAQGRSRRGEAGVSPDIGFRCAAATVQTR